MSITSEQRDAWVAALRSGRYRQGTGSLRRIRLPDGEEQFCCLGVLGAAVLGLCKDDLIRHPLLYDVGQELSEDVQERLAALNDHGATFAQIAALLENAGDPALWA